MVIYERLGDLSSSDKPVGHLRVFSPIFTIFDQFQGDRW
jgi:hypothetical protein